MIKRFWRIDGLLPFRGQVGAGLLVGDGGGRWDGTGGWFALVLAGGQVR